MESLVANPNFEHFVDALREMKDGAVAYAVSHTTVRDQRESLAALGEVRAYSDIISLADAHRSPVENQLVEQEQQPG
jgi:hypothetical protein